jgi:hypothetical protein
MEPTILQQYAAQSDRLLADQRRQVAHQQAIVSELVSAGRDSRAAKELLRQFETSLVLQVADRYRLHWQLGL